MPFPLLVTDDLARFTIRDTDEVLVLMVDRRDTGPDGHTSYGWTVRHNGKVIQRGEDMATGAHMDRGPLPMLCTFLGFLEAAGEAYAAHMRGRHSDNLDMFTDEVNELAYRFSEQIEFFRFEHEDN